MLVMLRSRTGRVIDPAWQKKVAGLVAKAVDEYRTTVVANGG